MRMDGKHSESFLIGVGVRQARCNVSMAILYFYINIWEQYCVNIERWKEK